MFQDIFVGRSKEFVRLPQNFVGFTWGFCRDSFGEPAKDSGGVLYGFRRGPVGILSVTCKDQGFSMDPLGILSGFGRVVHGAPQGACGSTTQRR